MKCYPVNMDKRSYAQRSRAASSDATRRRILERRRSPERGQSGRSGSTRWRTAEVRARRCTSHHGHALALRRPGAVPPRQTGLMSCLPLSFPDALRNLRASQRAAVRCTRGAGPQGRPRWPPSTPTAWRRWRDRGRAAARMARPRARSGSRLPAHDITLAEATEILAVITSFQSFDELFTGSRLPPETVAVRLIAMAERSVCRPDLDRAVSPRRRPGSRRPAGARSPASPPR
jgi:hypothetical protein